MSQKLSLENASQNQIGNEISTVNTKQYVNVSADSWGGGSVKIQLFNEARGEWRDLKNGIFTSDDEKILHVGVGQRLRAITDDVGTMSGVYVFFSSTR